LINHDPFGTLPGFVTSDSRPVNFDPESMFPHFVDHIFSFIRLSTDWSTGGFFSVVVELNYCNNSKRKRKKEKEKGGGGD
jgi:hypothetical protein